mmetsp:Transcript_115061/g.171980  ORF Transcript_115061/g.171980 Transcript_115061/m.171980 type:complete len:224 (-) Transcript_115061:33-704(-)
MFPKNIALRVLTPSYVGKAVDCIANSFADDPFSKVSGLQPADWAAMSGMFVERAATKDLSVIAVNSDNGNVEGVMLNEDWKEKKPEEYSQLSEKWRPIRAIFNKLHISYKARHSRYIQPHEILHPLYFSCIRPELRRKGLIGQLFNKSLEIASDYHFDTVVCESSTTSTALACGQLGFREIAQVEYRTFLYKGETVFYPLPGINPEYQKLTVLERPIQSNLVM